MADMNDEHDSGEKQGPSGSGCCLIEVRIKGQLGDQWSDWFENMDLRLLENGEMILFGPISDQAALMGILNKLNRLNLTLLSVNEVSQKQSNVKKEKQ
jgi:hypothetical protein